MAREQKAFFGMLTEVSTPQRWTPFRLNSLETSRQRERFQRALHGAAFGCGSY